MLFSIHRKPETRSSDVAKKPCDAIAPHHFKMFLS